MDEVGEYNLFVGGLSGVFKGLRVTYLKGIHNVKNLQKLKEIVNRNELTVLNWGDDEETQVLLGYSNQQVRIYDLNSKCFVFDKVLQYGEGSICGISKYNGNLMTSVVSGSVCLWNAKDFTKPSSIINTGGMLDRVRHSHTDRNIVAAGGKENDLSLWDLETQQRVFLAKNVRHDALELRVPVWVSDICFMPNTEKVAVCSRHGHVRLYDPTTPSRRPVVQVEVKDQAFMCIAPTPRDHHVVVGSGTGHMYLVDLRKGMLLNHYRGFVGGIRQIVCTPSEPYIASVGLDRHIRVHNLNTKQLLHKEYMQSRLSCILAKSSFTMSPDQIDLMEESDFKQEAESIHDDDSDKEYEAMFERMDIIMEVKKRTKKKGKANITGAGKVEDEKNLVIKDVTDGMESKDCSINKNSQNSDGVKGELIVDIKDDSDSETGIVKEVPEEAKNTKKYIKAKVFRVEQIETKETNETQMRPAKEVVTDVTKVVKSSTTNNSKDTDIIDIGGNNETIVESDEEVETVKVITPEKKPTRVSANDFEDDDSDIIEISSDGERISSVNMAAVKESSANKKFTRRDTDAVEEDDYDDDSDIIEIHYRKNRDGKGLEIVPLKDNVCLENTTTNDWGFDEWNKSNHGADVSEDDDSDIVEIMEHEIGGANDVADKGAEHVTVTEMATKGEENKQNFKTGSKQDEKIDVTEIEDHVENNLKEETVTNVNSRTGSSSKKGKNQQKQHAEKAKSVEEEDCLEQKEGSDKSEDKLCDVKSDNVEDKTTDVVEDEGHINNNLKDESMKKVDTNMKVKSNKKRRKKGKQSVDNDKSQESYAVERKEDDGDTVKNDAANASNVSDVRVCSKNCLDEENGSNVNTNVTDKSGRKGRRSKQTQSKDIVKPVEEDHSVEKEVSDKGENKPHCKSDDVTGTKVNTNSRLEEETTKNVVETKKKPNKRGRQKRNQSADNAKSQENGCFEGKEDSDKIENELQQIENKSSNAKNKMTDVTEVDGHINNSSEIEAVRKVNSNKKNKPNKRGRKKGKQSMDNDKSQESDNGLERKDDGDTVKNGPDNVQDIPDDKSRVKSGLEEERLNNVDTDSTNKSSWKERRSKRKHSVSKVECFLGKEDSDKVECNLTVVTRVEVPINNSSEEDMTKQVVTDKKKGGRKKRGKSADNAKSQENSCFEGKEDSDKIEISLQKKQKIKGATVEVSSDRRKTRISNVKSNASDSEIAEKRTPMKKSSDLVGVGSNRKSLRCVNKNNLETDSPKRKRQRNV